MQNNKYNLDEFHHIPLFEVLDDAQLNKMLSTCKKISLPARTTIFEKGTSAEYFYMLRSGQVKLFCLSTDGVEKVMEILSSTQTFAEAIMFMPKHLYPVSAETITDSELYRFEMKPFRELLESSNDICIRLLGIMARHLHVMINDINNLSLHNATYRFVEYLLEQLPEGAFELSDIHLSTPKNIIASRLSIQPETFSRILLQIRKKGLIEVHGNDICLLDVEGLRKLL